MGFLGGLNEDELKAFDKSLMPYFQPSAVRHIPPEIFQVRAWILKELLNFYCFYSSINKVQHWFIGFGFWQKIFCVKWKTIKDLEHYLSAVSSVFVMSMKYARQALFILQNVSQRESKYHKTGNRHCTFQLFIQIWVFCLLTFARML